MDDTAFTLDDDELPDVTVQSTPRPDAGSGASGTESLNGTWRFAAGPGDDPPGDAADWRRHDVPGQWEYEGYDVPDGERGWYRREFGVPVEWTGGRVILRFGGVCSDAVVRVNGDRVGSHRGGFTPFEVDVTDAVHSGDGNVLSVGVAETYPGDEVGLSTLGGGVPRDVTLVGVPACHVSGLDLATTIADDGDAATVRARTTLANAGDDPVDAATLRVALTDPDGADAGTVDREVDVGPGGDRVETVEIGLDEFAPWNPDQPRLYDLALELHADGDVERIERRVGIREVAVDGDELLLNGRPVTLRGVNWRESHPEYGLAVPADVTRRDVERLREANVTYVRTAHNPPSEAFVEACDELGVVVEMEAPIAFLRFENSHLAVDPDYRESICRQTLEAVERDRNRTSVCVWSLGNESDWGPNFEAATRLIADRDPTRPTTFNWGMYLGDDAAFCDVANHHYPALRDSRVGLERFDGLDRPVMFDEFAHLYCYDGRELATDPGLRDHYGRVLAACWEAVDAVDAFAGAAIWAGLDTADSERWWGLFDQHRRPRPEYWHVKKTYSPVALAAAEWRGDAVRVELDNRSAFASLADRRIEWRAGDDAGTLDLDAPPGGTGTAAVEVPADAAELSIRVRHARGFAIDEFAVRRDEAGERNSGGEGRTGDTSGAAEPDVHETPTEIRLETDDSVLAVDRNVGEVRFGDADADPVVSGLPGLVATEQQPRTSVSPTYADPISHRLHPWRCEDVHLSDDGAGVEVHAGYYYDTIDVAAGSFTFRLREGGGLDVEYDFALHDERTVRETGLVLPVDADCTTLSWRRESQWSAYPADHVGRREGTAAAFPGGDRPADAAAELDPTRPWAADATSRGSNDFRSTKRNVRDARLTDGDGRGVELHPDADRHVRCVADGDAVDLLVLDRSLAGVGLALLDRHALLGEEPTLDAGTRLRGTVTVYARPGADGGA